MVLREKAKLRHQCIALIQLTNILDHFVGHNMLKACKETYGYFSSQQCLGSH